MSNWALNARVRDAGWKEHRPKGRLFWRHPTCGIVERFHTTVHDVHWIATRRNGKPLPQKFDNPAAARVALGSVE